MQRNYVFREDCDHCLDVMVTYDAENNKQYNAMVIKDSDYPDVAYCEMLLHVIERILGKDEVFGFCFERY